MTARRHRGPGPRTDGPRDDGTSLAELVVAMGIFVMVVVVLGTTAVLATATMGRTTARLDNIAQADLATASTSKVLRTAVLPRQFEDTECTGCGNVAVLEASDTSVSFFGNLGRSTLGPTMVVLSVRKAADGTGLLEQKLVDPTPDGADRYRFCNPQTVGCGQTRTVARSLVWPSRVVFAYYDVTGALMPLAPGASLSSTQRARVSSIDLAVTVQTRPGSRWPAFTSITRVRLPNVEIEHDLEES